MRKTDIADGVTRSDSVWLTLAMDFVRQQLESGEGKETDVFSVVGMNSEGSVLLDRCPTDWCLYNSLVRLLRTAEPRDDGNYLPALRVRCLGRLLQTRCFGV